MDKLTINNKFADILDRKENKKKSCVEIVVNQDKEIERLKKENNDLRNLYQRTCNHLFKIGNDELARYFQAQINECNTFIPQGVDKE